MGSRSRDLGGIFTTSAPVVFNHSASASIIQSFNHCFCTILIWVIVFQKQQCLLRCFRSTINKGPMQCGFNTFRKNIAHAFWYIPLLIQPQRQNKCLQETDKFSVPRRSFLPFALSSRPSPRVLHTLAAGGKASW